MSTRAIADCDAHNARCPIGTAVEVLRDDGSFLCTRTTSAAWVLGGHTAVVMLDGIRGAYKLDRVHPTF